MENNKYKLVQIISHTDSVVQPITEDNRPYLDRLCTYEDDRITYAIYENTGDDDDDIWDEYANYDEDFNKARREYRRLVSDPQHNGYELTILLNPELMCPECEIEKITDKIKELGGVVNNVEEDGCKRLAYSIQGYDKAYYYYLTIQAPQPVATAISSYLNISNSVLRYLLVKEDSRRH